jgi:ubiquinone/menaquinone biosynthesis C-methylase UbiE
VLDVGGAAGAYAFWLSERGYTVHLLDAVPRLVDEARRRSAAQPRPLASCRVADARSLPAGSESVSLVLLLGPLYHLVDPADRAAALLEAVRVLRPGGILMAAAISRWASALDGVARNLFSDERFMQIVERDMETGQHRNPTDRLDYFTTAYFHRPEELRAEMAEAGFEVRGLYGIEGPAWILPDVPAQLDEPRRRAALLHICRLLESEPSVIGCSAHLLGVGRKTVK